VGIDYHWHLSKQLTVPLKGRGTPSPELDTMVSTVVMLPKPSLISRKLLSRVLDSDAMDTNNWRNRDQQRSWKSCTTISSRPYLHLHYVVQLIVQRLLSVKRFSVQNQQQTEATNTPVCVQIISKPNVHFLHLPVNNKHLSSMCRYFKPYIASCSL
jgi:hypothetical protein